jgi:hypothetical protein
MFPVRLESQYLCLLSHTATNLNQLLEFQSNVASITKSRIPRALTRLHEVHKVLSSHGQAYAACNGLFARFKTLIEEFIKTKPLLWDVKGFRPDR